MKKIAHHTSRVIWSRKRAIAITIICLVVLLGIFSYITNPFTRYSIIADNSIVVAKPGNQFTYRIEDKIYYRKGFYFDEIATLKAGWHILANRLDSRISTSGKTINEIITNIHAHRFHPDSPFLISGEHFSVLYPRSLGIFYHSLLDQRTALNSTDWENKQKVYLKTLLLMLAVYEQSNNLSTTIVPVWKNSFTLINVYSPPSDTLYSILYALQEMKSDINASVYPFTSSHTYPNETRQSAELLQKQYSETLKRHFNTYRESVLDKNTGLIKKDIYLSSTKDSVKRSSSLYDNIIYWRTWQLAQELGLEPKNDSELRTLKQTILNTFWLGEKGYFLEELGDEAVQNSWYSSDWLIAYQTGFLKPEDRQDRELLIRAVDHIIKNNIDQPFGIRYQQDIRPRQLHRYVRLFAREYGSTAIWSHWGMEYTKLLIHLAQVTGDRFYLERARQQLEAYKENIEKYQGYPEVYETDGHIYRTRFYRGIRSTGWIVNYEQAQAMYNWTYENTFNRDF